MKIAIHFYGHLRTYKKTYEYFVKNILHPNYTFASNIDIFFHTWDELNTTDGMGPSRRLFNAKLNHVSVTKEDIKELLSLYKPKRYIIEKKDVFYGRDASIKRVYKLRKEYEKEKCFTYDYYIFLRFDLLFATPFLLEEFISVYSGGEMLKMTSGLPENFVFIGSNIFRRCKVADFRFFQETDLFWISNYGDDWDIWVDNNFNFDVRFPVVPIAIDYKLNTDFYIWRDIYDLKKDIDPLIEVRKSILKHNEI
ncbi:hypothetical protein L8X28_05470, partial [Campylobacter sp. CNRCH_2016_0050h]|nr:hypothetical protein [Campylobacter sp. CNRCH_2016_0050h]